LGDEIFYVGLFEEAYSACDLVRDVLARKLHLEVHGMVVGSVENRDVA